LVRWHRSEVFFSDGSTLDITTFVTWTSSDLDVADVSNADVLHSSLWGGDLESFIFQSLARGLPFEVDFWKVQNAYYQMLVQLLPARRREAEGGFEDARKWVERFLSLGEKLSVKVDAG
jgi:hypothetical protein